MIDSLIAHNKGILREKTENELCRWLLESLEKQSFYPMQILPEPSPQRQLQTLFENVDRDLQEKLKAAVVRAVTEWWPESHGLEVLRALTILVAYIRASSAIAILRGHIDAGRIRANDDRVVRSTLSTIIAVMTGFAPHKEVESAFKQLFFDERFARVAAQLLNGLCTCSPGAYSQYLYWFLGLVDSHPNYFDLDAVMLKFIEVVKLPTLIEHFRELDYITLHRLLTLLSQGDSPLIFIGVDKQLGSVLIDRAGHQFLVGYTNEEDRVFVQNALKGALKARRYLIPFSDRIIGIVKGLSENSGVVTA